MKMARFISRSTACILVLFCACSAPPTDRVRQAPAQPDSSGTPDLVIPSPRATQAAKDDLNSELRRFALSAASQVGKPYAVAVLPVLSYENSQTPCSEYITDALLAAFIGTQSTVLDRQSLKAALAEIDLGAAFENPSRVPRIPRADVIVLGRYNVVQGALHIDLRATEVVSNRLLLVYSTNVPLDTHIRTLAFSRLQHSSASPAYQVDERAGTVRIRASHSERGGNQLRLLDRVRQTLRKGLADYLRNGHGLELTNAQIEERFRLGTEIDCEFETDSVTLEMEFGDQQ